MYCFLCSVCQWCFADDNWLQLSYFYHINTISFYGPMIENGCAPLTVNKAKLGGGKSLHSTV